MAGLCDLILNAKHLKEAAKNIVSSQVSVGDQPRTKTSSTNSAEDRFTPKFFRTCGPCYVIIQVLQWLRLGIQTNSRDAVICIALNTSTCDYMSSISNHVEVKKKNAHSSMILEHLLSTSPKKTSRNHLVSSTKKFDVNFSESSSNPAGTTFSRTWPQGYRLD